MTHTSEQSYKGSTLVQFVIKSHTVQSHLYQGRTSGRTLFLLACMVRMLRAAKAAQ